MVRRIRKENYSKVNATVEDEYGNDIPTSLPSAGHETVGPRSGSTTRASDGGCETSSISLSLSWGTALPSHPDAIWGEGVPYNRYSTVPD